MAVIKDKDNESYSLFIGSKEIFRGSKEAAAKAAGVTGAILGLGVGIGVGWAIASLAAATTPLAYLLWLVYIALCIAVEKKLGED